jgi:tetratricopeptide (TPR) repeat protein
MPKHIHPTPFIIQPPADLVEKLPQLKHMSAQLADMYASGIAVSEAHLQAMGRALWSALDVEEAFDAACKAAGAEILSVIVESEAAAVQALPWETLFHPTHEFIGKNPAFTFSRQFSGGGEASTPLEKGPLKVLLFTSMPEGANRLKVEEEQAQVQAALLPWILKGLVQLEMPDDGRFSTFVEQIAAKSPHVLFLSGHGNFHHAPHIDEAYGEFLFESETGAGDPVREDKIAAALIGSGVQAVILSACESGKAASDALNNGLTRRLSAQGIPHVIGMRESVLDDAGIQFARALCDALAGGERVDAALQAARIAMLSFDVNSTNRASTALSAEASLGQWCLPMLITSRPRLQQPLIDWDFAPQAVNQRNFKETLNTVSLPARFVGRRAEMRQFKSDLLGGRLKRLLITGAGGQGKTSLAGKLALDLQQKTGARIFAWSARAENPWRDFEFELELALDDRNAKKYDYFRPRFTSDAERAKFMLSLLVEQFERVALFLDNLETIQDPRAHNLTDPLIEAWMQAARETPDLILLATSRWDLPDWDGARLPLTRVNYGDFLQLAQNFGLNARRERLKQIWQTLEGNARGLELFSAAIKDKNPEEEAAFLDALARAKTDLQANMAIAEIYSHLPADAQTLLRRLPAYHEPVPEEGILKLGLDLGADIQSAPTDALLAVSLLEAQWNADWQVWEYQPAPLVTDWLEKQGLTDDAPQWRNAAADYHLYLLANERRTLAQAITAHHALRRAERHPEADRLTLDRIVYPLTLKGFYAALLKDWLPRICDSQDLKTRADALNQTGKLLHHLGDFGNALPFMKQSLVIQQQIGSKAGMGITLNNMATTAHAQGDYETALSYLKQSLAFMQQIGDRAGVGTMLNNISQIFKAQGDYETALTYLKQSLAIQQQIGDKAGEGTTLNNISQIFKAEGDYETALTYLKQSLAIQQQIGDKAGEGTTLNNIAQIYSVQGDYETALTYLKQSLAIQQQIGDKAGEGTTLNNISQIFKAQGDTETALTYLKQSLAIMQQIGDKEGLCATLFNTGHIHMQNNQMQEAVSAWVTVYLIAKQMNLAQALQALSKLAPSLGLPEGLDGWEQLAQRIQNGEKIEFGEREEVSQLEQIRRFVSGLAQAVREKSEDAQKYFESVSKMAVDPQASPEIQELGKVLRDYMAGVKNLDLSRLPEEWAEMLKDERFA